MIVSRTRPVAAALLLTGLLACASGPAPQDHFYRLQIPEPAAPLPKPVLPGTLEVERPLADHMLRERALLHSASTVASEVVPYSYHLWVDSPSLLVQRSLARYLEVAGVAEQTVLPEAGVTERWLVTGRLERLEHIAPTETVWVVLELRLRDLQTGRQRVQRRYSVEAPAVGGVDAAAPALGAALGTIFAEFTQDIAAAK